MKTVLLALSGAILAVLAFPPFGPGVLVLPGIALFLAAVRQAETPRQGLWVGAIYGLVFFGGLMWWLAELELLALVLVPVQAAFLAMYGWWLARYNDRTPGVWLMLSVGGWAAMELIRYRFPVGGLEWGAAGYALSDNLATRLPAVGIGTSGLTLVVVLLAALLAQLSTRRAGMASIWGALIAILLVATSLLSTVGQSSDGEYSSVAIVQGSTPCPFEHCPPDERLRTYEQHLELTRTIEAGSVDLVVWSEGSTGATNADPVLNEDVRESIAVEARRIGAPMLIGGDRVINDTEWVNANVYFDANGEILGEYRKQHPVPFGEYIPWRPVFAWIPALDRVPRDMVPGDGAVVFEDFLGSVISFEGGFSRYALETRQAGAQALVVATNEASYGPHAPTSDQFIGMTRMRAVELGVPVIHAAVTGRSTVISKDGTLGDLTALGAEEILYSEFGGFRATPYVAIGNLVMYVAALLGVGIWGWTRWLVGSGDRQPEEE